MSYYELHRNKQTTDLTGAWIGTNQDGMSSDDGVFEFVFIPLVEVGEDTEATVTAIHDPVVNTVMEALLNGGTVEVDGKIMRLVEVREETE